MATKSETQTCSCCGGSLPMAEVWEHCRNSDGDCDGSVTAGGLCRAYNQDAWELNEVATVLHGYGDRFSGNNVADQAQDWVDNDFSAKQADRWCEIGVWDANTAAQLRDADLSPKEVQRAAESLIEDMDSETAAETYTDGDPIYSVCNCDTSIRVLIEAAKK